tara:strand:+ start:275 stop:889 length:615 start_codon:yes stop_codon:yes gene_type:complete
MKNKVNLIQSDVGNVGSVIRVLNDLNYDYNLVSSIKQIDKKYKIILPGVGNYDSFIKSLKQKQLFEEIKKFVLEDKIKILGICVGMQSLLKFSEEGNEQGFGFINNKCIKFKSSKYKIPHIGWNSISDNKKTSIFDDIKKKIFYFAHSYHVDTKIDSNYVLAKTDYCYDFPSIINYRNIYGVQFHPEKSFEQGSLILKNFLEKC